MKVASINISKREQLNSPRGLIETGIFKKPVAGKIKITSLGINGDVIVDEAIHGGKDQAIYIYSLEDYEWWSRELGKTLLPGTFGENITLSGFSEHALVIGVGVMTGTMGGIFRDILCNEQPVVFRSPLYATVSWAGSFFIALLHITQEVTLPAIFAGVAIFVSRLLAIHYNICLPKFRFKT